MSTEDSNSKYKELLRDYDGFNYRYTTSILVVFLNVFNKNLEVFPPRFSYLDFFKLAIRRGWVTVHKTRSSNDSIRGTALIHTYEFTLGEPEEFTIERKNGIYIKTPSLPPENEEGQQRPMEETQ